MKIITMILLLTFFLTPASIYAQDTPERSTEEATVTEEQIANTEDAPTEELEVDTQGQIEEGTLSEDVTVTQSSNISFGGILLAVFTPLLLIIIAYLLIKMSNK